MSRPFLFSGLLAVNAVATACVSGTRVTPEVEPRTETVAITPAATRTPTEGPQASVTSRDSNLPANGINLSDPGWSEDLGLFGDVGRKAAAAEAAGFTLFVPSYMPINYSRIAHQISGSFDVSLSFAAGRSGSGIDITETKFRELPNGREITINDRPAMVRGSASEGYLEIYQRVGDILLTVTAVRSLNCGDPCTSFSEEIALAVAQSLVPLPGAN